VTAEIAAVIAEGAFYNLDGPVKRMGAMHVPIPFSPPLEDATVRMNRWCSRWRGNFAADPRIKNGRQIMALPTYGTMAVDWEQRIDFDRLRTERLARVKALLAKSENGCPALLRHE